MRYVLYDTNGKELDSTPYPGLSIQTRFTDDKGYTVYKIEQSKTEGAKYIAFVSGSGAQRTVMLKLDKDIVMGEQYFKSGLDDKSSYVSVARWNDDISSNAIYFEDSKNDYAEIWTSVTATFYNADSEVVNEIVLSDRFTDQNGVTVFKVTPPTTATNVVFSGGGQKTVMTSVRAGMLYSKGNLTLATTEVSDMVHPKSTEI